MEFIYSRSPFEVEGSNIWDSEIFVDAEGHTHYSERKCFIDALKKSGNDSLPFESLSLFSLEAACLANDIYVIFEDSTDE